ncbi:MAG: DUF4249 family protein [Prevotellaceae bacterium]|nr:DUF4249 family protein [Prevotellaceae bacterium]
MRYIILFIVIALFVTACSIEDDTYSNSEVVVEGWIDNGKFPIVILSRTVPISSEYHSIDDLSDYIERWATVTVNDGEQDVVLVGRYDDNYFPPYIYTTSEMRGVTGRTYNLTIDCLDGIHVEATTSIPPVATVDSFCIEPVETNDTLRQLYGYISRPFGNTMYYKFFTHVLEKRYYYMSSYLGITNSDLLPANGKMAVYQGRINIEKDFNPYFSVGDTVMVKFAQIDSMAYSFWRDFEDMTTLSRNPLFPVTNNLNSNIKGGLGYWFGYGSSFYSVIIE